MDAALEGKELQQMHLCVLIEAKDKDNNRIGKQLAELLGKVVALTNTLEDKSHQLSACNPFGTKINRKMPTPINVGYIRTKFMDWLTVAPMRIQRTWVETYTTCSAKNVTTATWS